MLKQYNWVIILLFLSGFFLLTNAQNNFKRPLPNDVDNRDELDRNHPSGDGFEQNRRGERRSNEKINAKLEKKMNEVLKAHFPNFYNKSIKLKEEHPRIYRKLLKKLRKHIRKNMNPNEEKKDLISIIFEESEVDILISKFKNSKNKNEKALLKIEIRKKLSEGFDKRENIQQKVISRIEKNIEEKKKKYQTRIQNKQKLVNKNLEELLK